MKKPKKITIKFFLNKNLHALDPSVPESDKAYPLYTQITYDRKNTQIKCVYGWYYRTMEQVWEEQPFLLPFEEKILRRSVTHELQRMGLDFRLKGLGRKYDSYALSIHALVNSYIKMRFRTFLSRAQPARFLDTINTDARKIDFTVLHEAAQRLFDNLEELLPQEFHREVEIYEAYKAFYKEELNNNKYQFPVVIDWIAGEHEAELRQKFRQEKPALEEEGIKLIAKIIRTKLELG